MTAKCIMIQGTGSSVGKSRLVTGLCRLFKQDGFKVAPFKSQNMALNSYITRDGLEMGRAQATQAEACGIEPSVIMNPILLKPRSDKNSQVIVKGKPFGNFSAMDYHEYKPKLMQLIKESYDELARDNDIIVIEGAGSPAEINLRERDIVNMGMAELVNAPVVIVGDIDRGGVFASLAGTMLLLNDNEKAMVKAVIINKFRGDLKLLEPGLEMLEDIIKRPVLGVVPYADIYIDEEDSPQSEKERLMQKYDRSDNADMDKESQLKVKVLSLPRITNFTDFAPLGEFPGIQLSYVYNGPIDDADMVLIPGSENPKESMEFIQSRGWDKEIQELSKTGVVILGMGSSYPLLGKTLSFSSDFGIKENIKGLGLLDVHIELQQQDSIRVLGKISDNLPAPADVLSGSEIEGYRIYSGNIIQQGKEINFIKTYNCSDNSLDGLISATGRTLGTFIHGIFDNHDFTMRFVNFLKNIKHDESVITNNAKSFDFNKFKEAEYDRWADIIRANIDIKKLYEIIGIEI
ncbi:Cobyric acid synthase [Tepidanaerobacter acetatoxydans Re1]|uniref:Cobyric acid synthase n=1 Tax=Tepidanaerobacter acetatoxydans (strain DSM 21804 / JCM 16047 / Re1) TaxID=1209989 RepID=F4LVY2_TEPAE|nr:cobyric acid synthase [Tepidanaerobacter acetatoxydans]AEE91650.1 Cobyric acid synthase [Tepidanaerobacter acetatoxydans Re1]CCP26392.1 Cobyric acid synthase [Tepidanaerobacter acetatoxydans Re1]